MINKKMLQEQDKSLLVAPEKHTEMSSREIITRVIEHNDVPRIGFDFLDPHEKDILQLSLNLFRHPQPQYKLFGHYQELLNKDSFEFPEFDESYMNQIKAASYGATDKFFTVYPPVAVFSTLRDAL